MADNTVLNPGALGDTIATDDIAGVKHQRMKMEWGGDGTATEVQDSVAASLPMKFRTAHTVTNVTTTPLGIGANYLTPAFNTEDNGFGLTFLFVADQSALLELLESHDDVTYVVSDSAPYPGGSFVFSEMHVAHAKYFKIRATNNSGIGMTSMTFQVIQRYNAIPWKIKIDENGNAVTQGADAPWSIEGVKGNNNEAPGSAMVPMLGYLVQATPPTYANGFMALPTLTTTGDQRITLDGETVPVTGTFWQATQPVSGPLTDTQLRATAVPVSGTVGISAGTNNIGDVDVLTLPALPAGTNNIGDVDVASLVGGATIATNQVSVGTGSTLIVAQRTGRRAVLVVNHGTVAVYVGVTGLTTGNGMLLPGILGATVSIPTSAAIYGIAGSAQTVSFMEVY